MTTYGIDVSKYQAGISWPAVKAAGVEFSFARATIGPTVDGTFSAMRAGALGVGLLAGAYHFLTPGNGAQQADIFLNATNECHGLLAALDCESQGLSAGLIADFVDRFAAQTDHPLFIYTGISFWTKLGNPPIKGPLWLAYYPAGSGYPGDASNVWNTVLGGQKPTIWQYGPRPIAGRKPVDGDAYRGTRTQLEAFTGAIQSGPIGGDVSPKAITDETPNEISVAANAKLFDLDGTTVLDTAGPLPWRASPYGVGNLRATYATLAGVRRLVLVVPSAMRPIPATGDVLHDVVLTSDGKKLYEGLV